MAPPSALRDARRLALLRELARDPGKFWDLKELHRPVMPSTSLRDLLKAAEKQGLVSLEHGASKKRNPHPLGAKITSEGLEELGKLLQAQE